MENFFLRNVEMEQIEAECDRTNQENTVQEGVIYVGGAEGDAFCLPIPRVVTPLPTVSI